MAAYDDSLGTRLKCHCTVSLAVRLILLSVRTFGAPKKRLETAMHRQTGTSLGPSPSRRRLPQSKRRPPRATVITRTAAAETAPDTTSATLSTTQRWRPRRRRWRRSSSRGGPAPTRSLDKTSEGPLLTAHTIPGVSSGQMVVWVDLD